MPNKVTLSNYSYNSNFKKPFNSKTIFFGSEKEYTPTVYLAGPDVFARNPLEIAAKKKKICEKYGIEGHFPLEKKLNLEGLTPEQIGIKISQTNEDMMKNCDLIIANMTPFRGPSMDVGTGFEMGFMRALGKPVYAYTNSVISLYDRTKSSIRELGGKLTKRGTDILEDPKHMRLENFGLTDNLMTEGAVLSSGACIKKESAPPNKVYTNLKAFEETVKQVAEDIKVGKLKITTK